MGSFKGSVCERSSKNSVKIQSGFCVDPRQGFFKDAVRIPSRILSGFSEDSFHDSARISRGLCEDSATTQPRPGSGAWIPI